MNFQAWIFRFQAGVCAVIFKATPPRRSSQSPRTSSTADIVKSSSSQSLIIA